MITLRQSPFDLFERLDQQLSQVERVPAAEIHETEDHYSIRLELPGVAHDSIDVKASDRSLSVSAERLNPQASTADEAEASTTTPCSASFATAIGAAAFASPIPSTAMLFGPATATASS